MDERRRTRKFGNTELILVFLVIVGLAVAGASYLRNQAEETERQREIEVSLADLISVDRWDLYKPDPYIHSASLLQRLGKERACKVLHNIAANSGLS